jgi:hypothetical protein
MYSSIQFAAWKINKLVDGLVYGQQWGQTYTSENHCHKFMWQGLEFFWEKVA